MYVPFGTERTARVFFGVGSVPSITITPAGCSGTLLTIDRRWSPAGRRCGTHGRRRACDVLRADAEPDLSACRTRAADKLIAGLCNGRPLSPCVGADKAARAAAGFRHSLASCVCCGRLYFEGAETGTASTADSNGMNNTEVCLPRHEASVRKHRWPVRVHPRLEHALGMLLIPDDEFTGRQYDALCGRMRVLWNLALAEMRMNTSASGFTGSPWSTARPHPASMKPGTVSSDRIF